MARLGNVKIKIKQYKIHTTLFKLQFSDIKMYTINDCIYYFNNLNNSLLNPIFVYL
jgi:hypothetical protein